MAKENGILYQLIKQKAGENNLDPAIIFGIIATESSFDVHAIRYEANSTNKVLPGKYAKINNITVVTESLTQQFSYGLMQVMGSTARWIGYTGPLPGLFIPEVNLEWGCKYLVYLTTLYVGIPTSMIAAYNAGSARFDSKGVLVNHKYVEKVLAASRSFPV